MEIKACVMWCNMTYFLVHPRQLYRALFSTDPQWAPKDVGTETHLLVNRLKLLREQRLMLSTRRPPKDVPVAAVAEAGRQDRRLRVESLDRDIAETVARLRYMRAYGSRAHLVIGPLIVLVLLYLVLGGAAEYRARAKREEEVRRVLGTRAQ